MTDIQRAARYYYLQRHAFGGKVRGRTFGSNPLRGPKINLVRIEEELSEIHLRLSRVTIENLDWPLFLQRYDRPETFFYLDPPYYKAPVYNHNMYLEDFQKMTGLLCGLKAKFVLSLNDHPDMRQVFKGFKIRQVGLKYTVNGREHKEVKELLITNF